ncbi:MAG: hypothetical protein FJ304_15135 [Planctomycetes bacterium]|nr:hypothetical protein [Planctomycetota bacterium]
MPSAAPKLIGTYTAPPVCKGERVTCLYRDADCVVTGFSAAPICWPRVRAVEHRGGSGLWVNDELRRAVRTESALALRHWFGVSVAVVWKWRKLFGVSGQATTEGSRAANRAASVKGAATQKARVWTPAERAAQSRKSKRLGLKPPGTGRAWTNDELALLGTAPDRVIGERIGRLRSTVAVKRRALGIAPHLPRAVPKKGGA